MKKLKKRFITNLIAIVLCLVSAFSLSACMNAKSSSVDGLPNTTMPNTPSVGKDEIDKDDLPVIAGGQAIDDYNTVFAGAVAGYEVGQNEAVFYDKFKGKKVDFKFLIDRQFDAMADYLYGTLSKVYGVTTASNTGAISGYRTGEGTINFNFSDTISSDVHKAVAGLSTSAITNKDHLNFKNAINGGYKIEYTTQGSTDSEGNPIQTYEFTQYSDAELITTNAWANLSGFDRDKIKQCLMDIYITYSATAVDTSKTFNFTSATALTAKYKSYTPANTIANAYAKINSIGLSEAYLWHVAYYLAYGIIGETNMSNSIDALNTVITSGNINSLKGMEVTPENLAKFEKFQNYKGYETVLKEIVFNMVKFSVDGNQASYSSSTNYFTGTNKMTSIFPCLKQLKYVFYDNIEDIADIKVEEFGGDEGEDFDSEKESEPTLPGSVVKIKEIIFLPHISDSDIESFYVDTIFSGFMKSGGSDFLVKMDFDAVYKDGSTKANQKSLIYSSEYEDIKSGKIKVDGTYDDLEENYDGAMYTDEELKDIETKYSFTSLVTKDSKTAIQMVQDSFTTESYTVTYSDKSSRTYPIGMLNVYNSFFDSDLNPNFTNNFIKINFTYYDTSGNELSSIPAMHMMYFTLESM